MSKNTIAKTVRVVTIPPLLVTSLFIVLYFGKPDFFRGVTDLLAGITFLALIPTLAYPLQPLIPGFRGKGRKGQRRLAFITSAIGYIGGILYAVISGVSHELLLIYGSYLVSVIVLTVFNTVLKRKASGHACGVAGPIAFLVYIYGPIALLGLPLLALVFWSSLGMGRHKTGELVVGSVIPIAAMLVSILFVSIV